MKEKANQDYRDVCFEDMTNGSRFLVPSTVSTRETTKWKDESGEERDVPLFKLETSAATHPFYTGQQKSIDTLGGRVERFRTRYKITSTKSAESTTEG
jgi:large subunit ribosomal protein L31